MKEFLQNIFIYTIAGVLSTANAAELPYNITQKENYTHPNAPLSACNFYAEEYVFGEKLKVEEFLNQIDLASKSTKDFKRLQIATDESYKSSENDIKTVQGIIDKTLLFQTSYFEYPTIERANKLKKILFKLIETQFLSQIYRFDGDQRYPHSHILAIFLHSFHVLRGRDDLTHEENKILSEEIHKRFSALEKGGRDTWFNMYHCQVGKFVTGESCANHTYYEQYIKTLYGYIFDRPEYFNSGERMFKFAIDDAKPDIGLWREAYRGWWAWMYISIGLTDLAGIAEVYRWRNIDLYKYKSDKSGLQYSDLVDRYIKAIINPNLIYPYSKKNHGLIGRMKDHKDPAMLKTVLSKDFPEKSNWYYLFEKSIEEKTLAIKYSKLADGLSHLSRYHVNLGFNPQCNYGNSSIKSPIKTEADIKKVDIIFIPRPKKSSSNLSIDASTIFIETQLETDDFIKYEIEFKAKANEKSSIRKYVLIGDFENKTLKEKGIMRQIRVILPSDSFSELSKENEAINCEPATIKADQNKLKEYWLFIDRFDELNECPLSTMTAEGKERAEQIVELIAKGLKSKFSEEQDRYGALRNFAGSP